MEHKHKKPVALVYVSSPDSLLNSHVHALQGHDFDTVVTYDIEKLGKKSGRKYGNIHLYVLDMDQWEKTVDDLLGHISKEYRKEGGPIILVTARTPGADLEKAAKAAPVKLVSIAEGVRPLRVAMSVEVQEFARIRQLRKEVRRHSSVIGQVVSGEFHLKTREEAQNLATTLSMTCPDPVPVAVGLSELLINGVEHGCLAITHDEKGALIETGKLTEEIARRSKLPEYADRYVSIKYERLPDKVTFLIRDGGDGFDFRPYLTETDGHQKKHGRGIMMAKGCFDYLEYRGKGNEVLAVHSFRKQPE